MNCRGLIHFNSATAGRLGPPVNALTSTKTGNFFRLVLIASYHYSSLPVLTHLAPTDIVYLTDYRKWSSLAGIKIPNPEIFGSTNANHNFFLNSEKRQFKPYTQYTQSSVIDKSLTNVHLNTFQLK